MVDTSNWTVKQARALYELPLTELVFRAQSMHRDYHPPDAVQLCTLLSVKTGGCAEDCSYCPQSARHGDVEAEPLLDVEEVLSRARAAKSAGATRFCMGAAWRRARGGADFERVLAMVRGVRSLDLEACVTLGMLDADQAEALAEAGLTAYNHNLDTSKEFYGEVITTRSFEDRLDTLSKISGAGIRVCSGGIIGMGETIGDRLGLLVTLANLTPRPESVPINALVPVAGTPLEDRPRVDPFDLVRMCALARLMLPAATVRLSAGRSELSREAQLLCFMAGANSIFYGDKLLTTGNPDTADDLALLRDAGLRPMRSDECAAEEAAPTISARA